MCQYLVQYSTRGRHSVTVCWVTMQPALWMRKSMTTVDSPLWFHFLWFLLLTVNHDLKILNAKFQNKQLMGFTLCATERWRNLTLCPSSLPPGTWAPLCSECPRCAQPAHQLVSSVLVIRSVIRECQRGHIHITFITVCYFTCSIILIVPVVNLSLGLIHKWNFITVRYV